jgi:hypothetical protein
MMKQLQIPLANATETPEDEIIKSARKLEEIGNGNSNHDMY